MAKYKIVFKKSVGKDLGRLPKLETLIHQSLIATIVLIPVAWVIDQPWALQPSLASVVALFASAWGTSITALLLYYYLINTIGASVASTTLRFA